MKTIILLYYRAPYCDAPDLICACDSIKSVNAQIIKLRAQWPDAYPETSRFETTTIELITAGGNKDGNQIL